jgi:hypothetical protein
MEDRHCASCANWFPDSGDSSIGECRRHAPYPRSVDEGETSRQAAWPRTMSDDGCGTRHSGRGEVRRARRSAGCRSGGNQLYWIEADDRSRNFHVEGRECSPHPCITRRLARHCLRPASRDSPNRYRYRYRNRNRNIPREIRSRSRSRSRSRFRSRSRSRSRFRSRFRAGRKMLRCKNLTHLQRFHAL